MPHVHNYTCPTCIITHAPRVLFQTCFISLCSLSFLSKLYIKICQFQEISEILYVTTVKVSLICVHREMTRHISKPLELQVSTDVGGVSIDCEDSYHGLRIYHLLLFSGPIGPCDAHHCPILRQAGFLLYPFIIYREFLYTYFLTICTVCF